MKFIYAALVLMLVTTEPVHTGAVRNEGCRPRQRLDVQGFGVLMQTVADGWNHGDAMLAASCFAENAVYSSPPSTPHLGRKDLYQWFGGADGREMPMHMTWHHLLFDPAKQVGVGDYTFRYRTQGHGLVIVKISNGLIANWREYEVESSVPWDDFVGENRF